MLRFFRLFTAVVLTLVALQVLATARASGSGYIPADESLVHSMVNQTRASKGLGALAKNDQLVAMARGQADRMAAKGDIYHNPRLGAEITESGLDWKRVGENVGMGPNVTIIEHALLDSPRHYENIIHKEYDAMGVGVTKGNGDGRVYVVQVFADLNKVAVALPPAPKPATAPAAPKPVAPAPKPAAVPAAPRTAPTPKPTLQPVPARPNALVGGYVKPVGAKTPSRPGQTRGFTSAGTVARVFDVLTFWS